MLLAPVALWAVYLRLYHVRFELSVVASSVSEHPREAEPIHGGFSKAVEGPQIILLLGSDIDLKKAAPQLTHHLYFKMFVSGKDESASSLWTGAVLEADTRSAAGTKAKHVYEVRIPTDLGLLIAHADRFVSDIGSYVAAARSGRLCVAVGGGTMWGISSLSGTTEVPLAIEGNRVVLR